MPESASGQFSSKISSPSDPATPAAGATPQARGAAAPALTLHPVNAGVVAVHLASGEPVGNFKRIGGVWKFKAMGYEDGSLVPGGGPLTHQHNRCFETLDALEISQALLGS